MRSRRLSGGSAGGDDEGLRRVISGGRRRTSFGVVADRGDRADDARRKSFSSANGDESGKWYWRVQAGATDDQLILLPLSQPANPVLTTPPQPLSHAMPQHSHNASQARGTMPGGAGEHAPAGEHEGIGAKIKSLFKRGSANDDKRDDQATLHGDETSPAASTTTTAVDQVVDQTAHGEMLPSAHANAVGATNLNANAETGWPGMINGQHLQAIVVDLRSLDKSKVSLGGGKKGEGNWVTVQVSGGPGGIEPVGHNHTSPPKSGSIKFEFDKDWIGGKGEAEVLHHYIITAIENFSSSASNRTPERHFPEAENFQLGHGNAAANTFGGHTTQRTEGYGDVAPDQRVPV